MSKILTSGVVQDLRKGLRLLKCTGRLEKGGLVLRQQVYMNVAAAKGPRWMQEHKDELRNELDQVVEGVRNEA